MTVKVEIASDAAATTWEDITDEVNLETARWAGTASLGEIDTGSGFDWRDDAGTRVIPWRRRVRVTETATTPDTLIWQGRTIGAGVHRGPIVTEDAKLFDVNLVDPNADFGGIAFLGTQRPAEDDTTRIQYLLDTYLQGQARPSTIIGDAYFETGTPYALIAHLYSGVQLIDWFSHITDTTGRDFFLTNTYDLWYNIPAATTYASGLSITDVSPNYTTSFPPILPEATEDATELFSGARVRWAAGTVTVDRSAVESANDVWRTTIVDESIPHTSVAIARANTFLDQFDHSRTSFRCGIEIPATLVDQISWGMTISFRSAACGVLSPTTYRITRLSWQLVGEGLWLADMEINYASKFQRASKPGPPPVVAPVPFTPSTGVFQYKTVFEGLAATLTVDSGDGWQTPGVGSLLVLWHSSRSLANANTPSGWTAHPGGDVVANFDRGQMFYKISDGTESSITVTCTGGASHVMTVVEVPGTWTLDDDNEATGSGTALTSGSVTPTSGMRTLIVGGVTTNTNDFPYVVTPGAGWTEIGDAMVDGVGGTFHPLHWMAYRIVSAASGSYNPSGTASGTGPWGGQTLAFTTTDAPASPSQGQPVTETATGDGATTAFTTTHPYAPLSLRVLVNGVDVTTSVTETSPSAGTFTFSSAPNSGATITIRYLGAAA